MTEPVLVIFVLLLIAALIGLGLLFKPNSGETEQQRVARESLEAERKIADIGRQAQAAIMQEALRRSQMRSDATRMDD